MPNFSFCLVCCSSCFGSPQFRIIRHSLFSSRSHSNTTLVPLPHENDALTRAEKPAWWKSLVWGFANLRICGVFSSVM